jgi:hypothetical protein
MKFQQLTMKTELPKWRASMPVFAMAAAPIKQRHAVARKLADHLQLGDFRAVELEHGLMLASERGDITVFHASGAVWARDATASAKEKSEMRDWPGLVSGATGSAGGDFALSPDAAKQLISMTDDMLNSFELLGREVGPASVQLEQVGLLDAKGNELERGAGQATVKYGYSVEGIAARGAGAKTLAFAEPGDSGAARMAGVFHAWRPLGEQVEIKMPSIEAAFDVALLHDPELDRYAQAGHAIAITRLELVYLALPAFMRQSHLFPVFQVEGEVAMGKLGQAFNFGRFHHVVPAKDYEAAGLHSPYLAMNPDGISPRAGRNALN